MKLLAWIALTEFQSLVHLLPRDWQTANRTTQTQERFKGEHSHTLKNKQKTNHQTQHLESYQNIYLHITKLKFASQKGLEEFFSLKVWKGKKSLMMVALEWAARSPWGLPSIAPERQLLGSHHLDRTETWMPLIKLLITSSTFKIIDNKTRMLITVCYFMHHWSEGTIWKKKKY